MMFLIRFSDDLILNKLISEDKSIGLKILEIIETYHDDHGMKLMRRVIEYSNSEEAKFINF
jgi:hypothetical protein